MENCKLCPRECNVSRATYYGFCQESSSIRLAKAFLHQWEEPCISGTNGSGTIFFSGCNLKCVYCQNHEISQSGTGKEVSVDQLCKIIERLEYKGAHNINLVNPTHWVDKIEEALHIYRPSIPIVYNTNGYERIETLKRFEGIVDVYLPDIKYFSPELSAKYSGAADYFKVASSAILEMFRQVGIPVLENGIIKRGLIVRHLVLPGAINDTKEILEWFSKNLPSKTYLSLMSQYIPMFKAKEYSQINRKLTKYEYKKAIEFLDKYEIDNGYVQELESASSVYTPEFDFEGI